MKIDDIAGQTVALTHLKNALKKDQISQAYMLIGEPGMGKKTIAESFAESILCEERKPGEYEHCGKCRSCHQVETGNHPDCIFVTHEKSNLISVDEIREQLVSDVEIKPYQGSKKVYIVPDAEMMNEQAQNALLKTLEEPPEYAVIILLVANADLMLPTLLSRSIKLPLAPLPDQVIEEKLIKDYYIQKYRTSSIVKFARGNLGRAIEMSENDDFIEDKNTASDIMKKVVKTESYQWKDWIDELSKDKVRLPFFLGLFMDWYRDILMAKSGAGRERLMFADEESVITEEAGEYDYEGLKYCIEAIEDAQAKVRANVKLSLVLENLFNTLSLNYGD
ncbi:MAG: DNA polymerase III subunit [Lachnospiraceae bacterium]|jgi:DNA polymerase-3 subunit delta'|nr:DNA polymerase III subunit [Lachnospiraceae bacterium]MDD5956674.1 DNA polymerase III subunit [Lachnospiraceae bacterium]MDY3991911.1 DNA polymerase III subunit [Lachnospiraceae bacterium]